MHFDLSCATATLPAKLPVQRHTQTMLAQGQGEPGNEGMVVVRHKQ